MTRAYITAAIAIFSLVAVQADAKGCLKGAAVGGVGGHFVGHGHAVAGAAVGCAVGHHRAKVAERRATAQHR